MTERLKKLSPSGLSSEQRGLYETISAGPRSAGPQAFALTDQTGALDGPFNAMLLSPAVGTALQQLGSAIRFESELTPRIREIAILSVAGHWRSDFETRAHEALGLQAGLNEDELASLRAIQVPESLDGTEALVLRASRALLADGLLDNDLYQQVIERLGEKSVFELSTLIGYYSLLAMQLRLFGVDEAPLAAEDAGPA
ncbi:carboxymuconolactone decarboxylase family protein [Saxibacter everestensis]|uniref:Carboxymuconolactone decarboxylase family protein n=1 Tax=Saxibacter everestensis TaxID=2909229 RepID=A0ABY8QR05_9MICO|nr:carboxymuconolactone decarboxylase family protein [Brevibacteriaceae bacterium ZFBP1038]